jgi:hypothetical protein
MLLVKFSSVEVNQFLLVHVVSFQLNIILCSFNLVLELTHALNDVEYFQ